MSWSLRALFLLLFFVGAALEAAALAPHKKVRVRVEILKNELEPYVRTTTRDVLLFNHFTPWPGLASAFPPEQYAGGTQALAWKEGEKYTRGEFGNGLYFATDPVASQGYGEHVLAVRVVRGTKFLDLNFAHPLTVKEKMDGVLVIHPESAEWLNAPGSPYRIGEFGEKQTLEWKSYHFDSETVEVFKTATRELGIELIQYPWSKREHVEFCRWKMNDRSDVHPRWRPAAFFSLHTVFRPQDTKVFFPDGEERGKLDLSRSQLLSFKTLLTPELEKRLTQAERDQIGARIQSEFFQCSLGSSHEYPEDRVLDTAKEEFIEKLKQARFKIRELIRNGYSD